jgi:hypothetical protein
MKNDSNETFIASFRASAIGVRFSEDVEADRVERKLAALKKWGILAKNEAEFWAKFRAKQAEIADCRTKYEVAETALREAGSKLYVAQQIADTFCVEREREEAMARAAVLAETNPHVQPLLFEPIRDAIKKSRAARPSSETKYGNMIFSKSGAPVPDRHFASQPAILARVEFLQRCLNHANEALFAISDDGDNTLIEIREAILAAAPSVEKMVSIPLTRDGARQATDKEILAAVTKAEELAAKHFGVAMRDAK